MAERVKTTEEILADPEAFKTAVARASVAFQHIDGVVTVGHGVKQIDATFGHGLAIIVFVKEKKPAASLSAAERIPPVFEGYPTDVREIPIAELLACDNTAKYTTIQGGIQIIVAGATTEAGTPISAGTLGAIVRRRNHAGRENVYMLSNAHVMYAMNHGRGDSLRHPQPNEVALGEIQDGGAFRTIVWPPGTPPPNPLPFPLPADIDQPANHTHEAFIDCAIASLHLDSCCGCTKDTTDFTEAIIDINSVTPPGAGRNDPIHNANRIKDVRDVFGVIAFQNNTPVKKVGRTTGLTNGICVGVAGWVTLPDPFTAGNPAVQAYNCLEIVLAPGQPANCKGRLSFAEKGDSGALVLDANDHVVGILAAGPPANAPANKMSSFACHIVPVLDHLGICIPCAAGATGHGSSLATDGSGLAPVALPAAQSTLQAGQIVFTADGGARVQPTAMAPAPMDEAQGRRMHALLEEFRGTRLGGPLSAVIDDVRRELGHLVRNVRPVKVVWGRHQGPAWLAHFLNHIAGHTPAIPREIKGVTRRALLTEMRAVLGIYGSNLLKRALDEHADAVIEMLTFDGSDSLADVVAWIKRRELADERARDESLAAEEVS